ncbi:MULTISPECIES: response regulator transcription factor [Paenibacillus]|jgi:OmpR family two-component system response regulator YxdJ|uniref:response regulator transcription factor n=1 Tax=Paenibacillus TaxID=44249 RepID=UPI0004F8B874|nr:MULTISPECIES: response regulator transcription factor [Paenibacillus]AIQ75716.1 PhoB family transcriptional regulator [Paenibacillus odorifer]MDH6429747.1 OmpR family two-component system response regulator YxdJ [Paenibacillus sp. PastH-4]MDH6446155.1 OmpR family two-component system response regulator YxdJ [Paenibacillus sp. PastF-4]MDH6530377.1 OmpR family two-component system response regulator YxdJ [Paenibacillus sp. PastH-3]OMD63916.1 DNA-binding response regulator [Paenibacillus odori
MFKIFIIEDDRGLVALLQDYLHKFGYETQAVSDFERVRTQFEAFTPHLVLLDVNLPKYDGYYWCRQIRGISTCPILFISARDGKMDQVMALENGADDYITKPFDYEIAMAKIKSQLRRAYGTYAGGNNERTLNVAGMTLDVERLILTRGEAKVDLSHTEAKILDELMQKSGVIVTRDRLLEKIWDDQAFVDENTLNVYVTRVRKKLAALAITDGLQTVRGQGYRLIPNWGDEE